MDIQEILADFQIRYPSAWPEAVLDRFVYLASRTYMTDREETEYIIIRDWIQDTINAGIAFRQQSLIEH